MIMIHGKCYRYKGVTFEWHFFCGPIILNRNAEKDRKYRNISLRIWGLVGQFGRLSKDEQQQYRIY